MTCLMTVVDGAKGDSAQAATWEDARQHLGKLVGRLEQTGTHPSQVRILVVIDRPAPDERPV